jgi:hypothetical protein
MELSAAARPTLDLLDFPRAQQHMVAAFGSGMHARLGAASGVLRLD